MRSTRPVTTLAGVAALLVATRVPAAQLATPGYDIRIDSQCAEGEVTCALEHLVAAAGDDPDYNEQIWHLLNRSLTLADGGQPSKLRPALRHLPAWRSLQQAVVYPFSRADSREAVSRWLTQHPDHPAALIPPAAVTRLLEQDAAPIHVALLLPYEGRQTWLEWFVETITEAIRERVDGVGQVRVTQVPEPVWTVDRVSPAVRRQTGI